MSLIVGCEYSGAVRDAFVDAGYDAWSCDLLPTEGKHRDRHIQGDIRDALASRRWRAGIFFPDCTYLCSSGLHWNKRGRMVDGRPRAELTEEALAFVQLLMDCGLDHWALENPTGCISTRIRKPDQIIQPYNFGADASKATCLWLHNLPKLPHGVYVKPRLVCDFCGTNFKHGGHKCPECYGEDYKPRWANQTDSGQNRLAPGAKRGLDRARTYPGVARAMAKTWGPLL